MNARFVLPVAGVAVAVGVTASLDASGLTVFSALPLLPLTAALWFVERLARRDIGLPGAGRATTALPHCIRRSFSAPSFASQLFSEACTPTARAGAKPRRISRSSPSPP